MNRPTISIFSSTDTLSGARALAEKLQESAQVSLWPDGGYSVGTPVIQSLAEIADRSDFAIVVLDANAVGTHDSSHAYLASNLLFELGFLVASLGRSRTIVLAGDKSGSLLPSHLAGTAYLQYRNDLRLEIDEIANAIYRLVGELGVRRIHSPGGYSSCFISYAYPDRELAEKLHSDLTAIGIASWLDIKDLQIGADLNDEIHRALQAHDRMLPILSENSVHSRWVMTEVREGLRLEAERQNTVLFPIRTDDAVFSGDGTTELDALKDRLIGDFTHWRDPVAYQREFSRLARALAFSAAEASEALR